MSDISNAVEKKFLDQSIKNLLKGFDKSESNNILYRGIESASKYIQKEAKSNLRRTYYKTNSRMFTGIKVSGNKYYCESKVSIMGYPLLRIIEVGNYKGTRKTKKGYNRGNVRATNFFKTSRSNESGIIQAMDNEFTKQLRKI